MKTKHRTLLNVLLGAGLYLLDPVRDRLADRLEDISDRAKDTYDSASTRLSRASDAMRGDDSHALGTITALLVGIGVGVGVGLLMAPASGAETRNTIANKVQGLGEKVWNRTAQEAESVSRAYSA